MRELPRSRLSYLLLKTSIDRINSGAKRAARGLPYMPFSRTVRRRRAEKRDQENQATSSALATPRQSTSPEGSQDQVLRDANGIEQHQNGTTENERKDADGIDPIRSET